MNEFYPEDKWVVVNGLRLHYLYWGGDMTLKPLILTHGIGGNAHDFDAFARRMSDHWRVFALDARGCGDSDWSREGYAVESFASDVAQFAAQLGLLPFDYYGHTRGSRTGIALGAFHGNIVDHLVLGDHGPLPDPSPRGTRIAQERLSSSTRERPKGFFTPQAALDRHRGLDADATDAKLWDTIRRTYRTNWDGILVPKSDPEIGWLLGRTGLKEGTLLWECMGRIPCKTLVLRGEESHVLDREQAQKMAQTIPNGNGSFDEVPFAGHGLHQDNMDATVNMIRGFILD